MYTIDGNLEYEIKYGSGIWKEYYNNHKLKYFGNYLYGEKNGLGKEYNCFGDIYF